MFTTNPSLPSFNPAAFDGALRFSNVALEGAQRISELYVGFTKDLLVDFDKNLKAVQEIKDVEKLLSYNRGLFTPAIEKSLAFSRAYYDVLVGIQGEFSQLAEAQLQGLNKQVLSNLDDAVKAAPASESAVAALKSAMAAASSAYDTVSDTAKKVAAELTEASVAAVATTAQSVAAVASAADKAGVAKAPAKAAAKKA